MIITTKKIWQAPFWIGYSFYRSRSQFRMRTDGSLQWIQGGYLHRDTGPAGITADGQISWWVKGIKL